jgi:hypothetical protein
MLRKIARPFRDLRTPLTPAHRRTALVWAAVCLWASAVLLLVALSIAPVQPAGPAAAPFLVHLTLEDLFPKAE